ncbi:MAG: hypothetical protein RL266_1530, partial [Bacteroidota bacterium]
MNSLQNIHLRRIHWAIFSPSLLSYPFSAAYVRDDAHAEAILDVLKQLDEIPDEVDAYFDSLAKLPMGKYFEQLLFYIFEKDERFEVLAKNHQVKQGNETIGEIDLILKDVVNGTYEHWEIALKFYLQSHASDQHDAFIGPNGVDDLAKKMKKLTERQIPLTIDQTEIG